MNTDSRIDATIKKVIDLFSEKSKQNYGSSEFGQRIEVPSDEYIAVEVPLYYKDSKKIIKSMGGEKTVGKVFNSKNELLSLKLRPEEISSHPIFADKAKTSSDLLLRVKRKRNTNKITSSEVIGKVPHTYRFSGIADFQYISRPEISDKNLSFDEVLQRLLQKDSFNTLEMVPSIFSKVDIPNKYEFQPRSGVKHVHTTDGIRFVDITCESVPADPLPSMDEVNSILPRSTQEKREKTFHFLVKKFDDRPIWTRFSLCKGLSRSEKRVVDAYLPAVAYSFTNGPWRTAWVRMGYDPRTSSHSAPYQILELRLGNRRQMNSMAQNRLSSKRRSLIASSLSKTVDINGSDLENDEPHDIAFESNSFKEVGSSLDGSNEEIPKLFGAPVTRGILLQLCDADVPDIKNLIESARIRSRFSRSTGWYSQLALETIRLTIRLKREELAGRTSVEIIRAKRRLQRFRIEFDKEVRDGISNEPASADSDSYESNNGNDSEELIDTEDIEFKENQTETLKKRKIGKTNQTVVV